MQFSSLNAEIWPTQMSSFDDLDLLEVEVDGLNCLKNILYTMHFARQAIHKSYNIISVSPRLQYVFGDIAFCKFSDLWPIWPGDTTKVEENQM